MLIPGTQLARDSFCSTLCMRRSDHYAEQCIGSATPLLLDDLRPTSPRPREPPDQLAAPVNAVQTLLAHLHIQERQTTPATIVLPPSFDSQPYEGGANGPKAAPTSTVDEVSQAIDQMDLEDAASEAGSEVYEEDDDALRAQVREALSIRQALRAQGEDV
jgi:hypothetical protein